jgi:hypothetical protein
MIPLLVHRRSDAAPSAEAPTVDELMPFPVAPAVVRSDATKITKVRQETTDDE